MGRAGTSSHLSVLRVQLLQTMWKLKLLVCSVGRCSPRSGRAGRLSRARGFSDSLLHSWMQTFMCGFPKCQTAVLLCRACHGNTSPSNSHNAAGRDYP